MQSNKEFKPTPAYLRELVLDYLLHSSYVESARIFAKDSAPVASLEIVGNDCEGHVCAGAAVEEADCEPDVQMEECQVGGSEDTAGGPELLSKETVRFAQQRQEIRLHIMSGRIDEATRLLHHHFPQVLLEPEDTRFPSSTLPPSRAGNPEIGPVNATDSAHQRHSRTLIFDSRESTQPVHIALNLRIQDFIESVRTTPLPYPPQKTSSTAEDSPPTISTADSLGEDISLPTPAKLSPDQRIMIHKIQRLFSIAQSLTDPRDNEMYVKEVRSVGALLAYVTPEESSIAHYLSQQRRESLADQVNSAILFRLGKPAVSHLELYTRYTTAVWGVMHDMRLPCPQGQSTSETAPPVPVANRKLGVLKNEPDDKEIIKPFDLGEFLNT